MMAGSLSGALALVLVALAHEPLLFTLGWIVAGVAMSACLYDPAFASLYQIDPDRYRRSVTGLTLFGGFASTVFWPLSHALELELGWRATLFVFAALNLLLCLPIHHAVLPRGAPLPRAANPAATALDYAKDPRFFWLGGSFAGASFVFSALSAFMIAALESRGFSAGEAVWIAALIGPMQVLARAVEWLLTRRVSAIGVGITACTLSLAGMLLLTAIPPALGFGALFAICYGASNGILTIARGTVPVELFGPQQQGALLGALARPSFVTKALAPALFAAGLDAGVSIETGLALLALISAGTCACFLLAVRKPRSAAAAR